MLLSTGTIVNGTPFSFVVFGSWYMRFVKSVDSEESMNGKKTEVNAYNGSESKRKKTDRRSKLPPFRNSIIRY